MTATGEKRRRVLPGELAVCVALLINSLAVTLYVKSRLGMSVVSGVPYVVSLVLPVLSMGIWSTVIQCAWIAVIALALRRFRPSYLFSFVLAAVFGPLLDLWTGLLAPLPEGLVFRLGYFALAFALMSMGIALFVRCGTPVLPFDTVPRELVLVKGWDIRKARTLFDLTNLVIMLALGLIFLGYPAGIGVGSVVNALLLGTGSGWAVAWLDRRVTFKPRIEALAKMV